MEKVTVTNNNSIWKLMTEHRFIVDDDSINEDFECMLCHNLMVDACQTRCCCQYCYSCIANYLENEDKYCPGNKSECTQHYLVLESDVLRDPKTNNKILKSKVFCPNHSCRILIKLSNMEAHLEVCQKQFNNNAAGKTGAVLEHINTEIYSHMDLIMNNMKNEFGTFKATLEILRSENESLKETSRIRDIRIDEIENMREELRNKEERITELERRLAEMERDQRVQGTELSNIKRQLQTKENVIIGLRRQVDNVQITLTNEENKRELNESTVDSQISDLQNKVMAIDIKNDAIERKVIYYSKWNELCPNVDVDFVWKIEDLSLKKQQNLFSESFIVNDYKFCLCLNRSADNIALWCYIMKGDDDEELNWPMTDEVTLSIVNQDTLEPHKSVSYEHDRYPYKFRWVFKQPKGARNNRGIGSPLFVRYSAIKDIPSVIVNDSIVVFCRIEDND